MEHANKLKQYTFSYLKDLYNFQNYTEYSGMYLSESSMNYFNILEFPCRIEGVAFVLATKGEITLRINLKEYVIKAGMIYINVPENIVQYVDSKDFECRLIAVDHETIQGIKDLFLDKTSIYLELKETPYFTPPKEDMEYAFQHYDNLKNCITKYKGNRKKEISMGYLSILFNHYIDTVERVFHTRGFKDADNVSNGSKVFETFMQLLTKHHTQERTIKFYANILNLTPKYFSKLIKNTSGQSAGDWIDDFVILEAKNMLRFSDNNIKTISYNLNFATPSLFSRYFKQKTGLTPQKYRLLSN
ncbi:MAG: AraC family transcriptional regulator [Marinifilaceae bacterium]|jgi:AraC-like DNA-binding protein|nr:AraC family transcriptional regulator [Marinifilaceae bacterium]